MRHVTIPDKFWMAVCIIGKMAWVFQRENTEEQDLGKWYSPNKFAEE